MKRRLKNGIIRHYCDKCGAPLYDEQISVSDISFLGFTIPESKIVKRFREFSRNKQEVCKDCNK